MRKFILIGQDKSTLIMNGNDFEIPNLELSYKVKTHKNKKELLKEIDNFLEEK